MRIRVAIQAVIVAAVSSTLSAHHTLTAIYDTVNVVPLTGIISRVDLVNPHVTVTLESTGPDGRVTAWVVEMAPPGGLKRRSFDMHLLEAGRQVVIESWLRKDGTQGQANGRTLVLPDGRRFDVSDNWDRFMIPAAR